MMHDQAHSWPCTSTPTSSAYPHLYSSETNFDAEGRFGTGAYGAYASWPSAPSSIPVRIPQSTSSSLAAALVSPPSPARQLSEPPSKELQVSKASLNSSSSACEDSANAARACDMSNTSRRSNNQSFTDPNEKTAFDGHGQVYQGQQVQAPMSMPSQSSGNLSYPQIQAASSSTAEPAAYAHHAQQHLPPQQQQQQLAYSHMQTNEPLWPPDPGFSMYHNNPPPNPSPVNDPSNFPILQQSFFDPTGVGGYGAYTADSGIGSWPYQAQVDMYFDFNAASTGQSAWTDEDSFGPQNQNMSDMSNAAPPITAPVDHRAGYVSESVLGRSAPGPDAGIFDGNYFSEHTSQDFQQQPTPYRQYTVTEQHSGQQLPYEPTMEQYATQHTSVHSHGTAAAASSHVAREAHSQTAVSQTAVSRKKSGARKDPQGHNPLMAPPPVPARARTTGSDVLKSGGRTQTTTSERRHTVAEPSGPVVPARSAAASPSVGSHSAGNTRSSSAGPPSSSSDSHDSESRRPLVRPMTPQMAITHLGDAQWTQAQEVNRCALAETYRIYHGAQEPPAEMRIKETSALERSRRFDAPLSVALARERSGKAKQTEAGGREENTQSQTTPTSTTGPDTREARGSHSATEDMSDEEFFSHPIDPHVWTPAVPVPDIQKVTSDRTSTNSNQVTSPISSSSTEELITPRDPCADFSVRPDPAPYAYEVPADPSTLTVIRSEVLDKSVLPILRHDGHLASHVSGLGGACVAAYDGRSYLPDDADMDPNHIPRAPPGARSGDSLCLANLKPHPFAKRGEMWHDLTNPPPPTPRVRESNSDESEDPETAPTNVNEAKEGDEEGQSEKDEEAKSKCLAEKGVKKEEKGLGWGFVEGGSHGPAFALSGNGAFDKIDAAGRPVKRLKLSTEKKTTPKMACHFCRNRKIACGASKCGDPSLCNQCERRELRCTFPTISRRGMRSRGARSGSSFDGFRESDFGDFPEDSRGEYSLDWETPEPNTLTKSGKVRKTRDKVYKVKAHAKGRGKGKGKAAPLEGQEDRNERRAEDVEMGEEATDSSSHMQVDDPLASLAAEMRRHEPQPLNSPPSALFDASSSVSVPGFSSNHNMPFPPTNLGGDYSVHMGSSHTLFTALPLHQHGQPGNNSSS